MEAKAEQDVADVGVVGDASVAERAEEGRVVVADQAVPFLVGDCDAVAQIPVRTEIPPVQREVDGVSLGGSGEDRRSDRDDFGTDTVSADGGELHAAA